MNNDVESIVTEKPPMPSGFTSINGQWVSIYQEFLDSQVDIDPEIQAATYDNPGDLI